MRLRCLLGASAVLALLCAPPVVAGPGQAAFRLARGSDAVTLDYRLEDPEGKAHRLRFAFPAKTIEQTRGRFKAYDPRELQRAADAEAQRQIGAAVVQLRGRYPQAAFEVRTDGTIRWTVGSPPGFEGRQQAIYDEHLGREIVALQGEFPKAKIEPGDGHFAIQAQDQTQLRRIEQRLLAAQGSANQALAEDTRQVKRDLDRDADAIRAEIESDLAAMEGRVRDFAEGFVRDRLYTLAEDQALRPDYARIARLALDDLAPAVTAMRRWTRGMSRRDALGHLLLFTQSIPYDPLEDRGTDAGFRLPALVLADNRGDCDSKAVTFAALAHLLYPDLPIAMVLLPRHAYLALGLKPEPGDQTLDLDGRVWTQAEAAGPGLLPIGRLAPQGRVESSAIKALVPLFP